MMRTRFFTVVIILGIMTAMAIHLPAVESKRLEVNGVSDFKKGELKSLALSGEGKLLLAPKLEKIYATGEDLVWDAAFFGDTAYVATGNKGKVFTVNIKSKKGRLIADQKELEIYAIAANKTGTVYYGASPGGIIYSLKGDQEPRVFFETGEEYIWDIVLDDEGTLYCATGVNGKIFKISSDGEGTVFFDSPAANVLSLVLTPEGEVLAGTQGKALIYRISAGGKGFVLHESALNEVRDLALDDDGTIYAAVNSEQTPRGAIISRMLKLLANSGKNANAKGKEAAKKEQSRIIKISPEAFVSLCWMTDDTPVNALYCCSDTGLLLVSAGEKGRLYQIDERGDFVISRNVDNKYILSFTEMTSDELLLGAGSKGDLYQLNLNRYGEGTFISKPLDAGRTVKWGQIESHARLPQKSSVAFRYRAGNTSDPDDVTWTDWSKLNEPKDSFLPLDAPISRFIQVECRLKNGGSSSEKEVKPPTSAVPISERFTDIPALDYFYVYYIDENAPPEIKAIKAEVPQPTKPSKQNNKKTNNKSNNSKNGTQKNDGLSRPPNSNPGKLAIAWSAADPNKDQLEYELYFKAEEEQSWKLVEDELKESKFLFSTTTIPDGYYRFKVRASDKLSNPPGTARTDEFISDVITVDNTSPEIVKLQTSYNEKEGITVSAQVNDATSILVAAHYTLDAGDPRYLLPADGIFDSREEEFSFTITELQAPGEHIVSLLVTDAQGNSTVKKSVVGD